MKIICPRCRKEGFLCRRYILSSGYYPKKCSLDIEYLKMAEYRVSRDPTSVDDEVILQNLNYNETNPLPRDMKLGDYIKMARKRISGNKYLDGRKEKEAYRVRYKGCYYYVGHYDAAKYQTQMIDYKSGKRKSRPTGRTWCKLAKGIDPDSLIRIS